MGVFLLARAIGFSKAGMLVSMLLGTLSGVAGGLLVNFGLAPFFIRKMLPTEPLDNGRVVAMIEDCFRRSGLPVPSLWVIRLDKFRFGNAMVAGFTRGKGVFTPGLFISGSLLKELEPEELRAIIAHEVSHLALNHLRSRFLMTLGLSAAVCALTGILVFTAYMVAPPEIGRMAGPIGALVSFAGVFVMMRRQSARHESEADRHSVEVLGAGIESFASALRKLDRMNDQSSEIQDPSSYLSPVAGHPATEARIRALREALGDGQTGSKPDASSGNKAA
jgi:Zn-dependent protease with chaperone function